MSSVRATAPVPRDRSPGAERPGALIDLAGTTGQITTVQWAIGIYCALIGALMLVAPHQFSGPLWSAVGQFLPLAGSTFLLAATALIGCAVLGAARPWVVLSHLAAGAAMLTFVFNFFQTGVWPELVFNLAIALGTALAPFFSRVERREHPSLRLPHRLIGGYR